VTARPSRSNDARQETELGEQTDKKRLLLVDDSATMRRAAELIFHRSAFELVTVASAASALAKLATYKPDIIFVDSDMPSIDGFELCLRLRDMPALRGTSLVLMVSGT
jgi:PleD family two-component response regulator